MKIIEAEVCPEHVHMMLEIPPKVGIPNFMGYLKEKSSLMIYENFPKLKYKYRNREFRCREYSEQECKENREIHKETVYRRLSQRTADDEKLLMNPFTGSKQQPYASVRPYQHNIMHDS